MNVFCRSGVNFQFLPIQTALYFPRNPYPHNLFETLETEVMGSIGKRRTLEEYSPRVQEYPLFAQAEMP